MKLVFGEGSCGIAAGARKVRAAVEKLNADGAVEVGIAGCIGMCYLEPIVDVYDGGPLVKRLVKVQEKDAERIYKAAASGDLSGVKDLEISADDKEFLEKQTRIALRHCGLIDPEDIAAYEAVDGYKAIRKVLAMTPEDVIAEIKTSGLAGRGGAGFPTWFKWNAARNAKGDQKYLICNADEGDPGAFMDRAVIESDPHSLIEGMLIAAYAIGATKAFVYVRAEYPLAIVRLEKALAAAKKAGLLGENILGSGFSCDIRIKAGAGAFVCGEETALIESLEGNRGMPRLKPPFPAEKGYTQAPSNINNVETFANVAWIILNGGAAFAAMGTETSKGTKVFALTGKIKRGGLVEIPMGLTLRDVIFGIGGGIRDGGTFKAVQMGGPPRAPARHEDRLQGAWRDGRDHGLRRHGGDGLPHVHGEHGAVLPRLHGQGELRQVRPLPHRHEAHARDPHAHHRGQGQGGRRGAATWSSSRNSATASRRARSAAWGRRPRTPSSPRSATSATSTTPTSARRAARRTSARR